MQPTTIHHETYGAGSLVSHDGSYVVVRFGTATHRFRANSQKLSGVPTAPTVQATSADDSWKRVSLHGATAGYRRIKPTSRSAGMSAGRELSRLGVKGSSAARQALDAARLVAPDTLCDLEPTPSPVLALRSSSRGPDCPKCNRSIAIRDAVFSGHITPQQGRLLAQKYGIEWTSR